MMSWLLKIWGKIKGWFFTPTLSDYSISRIDDLPDEPMDKTFYLVGEEPHIWCGIMHCPCGCGGLIHLNLLPEGRPKWNYKIHQDNTISIHPSIWRVKGCRSHFFLQTGNIIWCKKHH